MKNFRTIFRVCLIALTLLVFSCNKSEFEDFEDVKTTSENPIDDISYVGSDVVLGNFIDEITTQLREYKKTNPNISDEELNLYVDKTLKNSNQVSKLNLKSANIDMDGYITGKLNSQENALYKKNKAKALLCMANGKLAITYSESNYNASVLHNGNGDAFRHALWTFGMTIDVGSTFAKTWSDAHENGTANNPEIEKTMDLYNNKMGIQLGKDNPNTIKHSTFISKTKEKVRGGKLKIIKNKKLTWSDKNGEK